jgi:siroheme synthase (precorrin-2 oxidase/ferrochelatase)
VTLVAPSIKEEIFQFSEEYPNVQLIESFRSSDLLDKDVIISATNNKELNSSIGKKLRRIKFDKRCRYS